MNNVVVKQAGVEDAELVATLMSEFNAILGADGLPQGENFLPRNTRVSPSQMANRLQRMADVETAYVARLGGEAAGLACLRLVPYIGQDVPYAELTQLYVRERFQRHGVGAALVAHVEREAVAAGATCVHIITSRDDNEGPQAFYRSQGYEAPAIVFEKYFTPEAAHA